MNFSQICSAVPPPEHWNGYSPTCGDYQLHSVSADVPALNYTRTADMDTDYLTFAGAPPKGARSTNDILFDAFLAPDAAAPEEPVPRALASTQSLPNVAGFMQPAHVFTTASVPATPAQAPYVAGAATVPTGTLSIDSALLSFLGTPALASPGPLFAPLDELRGREPTDELLGQLAADPALRQSLVHALVDYIQPTVAYTSVGQSPRELLAATAPEPAPEPAMWVNEADASLVGSLLELLSPVVSGDALEMLSPDTSLLSPAMGLLSPDTSLLSPAMGLLSPAMGLLSPDMALSDSASTLHSQKLASIAEEPAEPASSAAAADEPASQAGAQRKRFHCDICNRGFSRQYNMRTHRLTHNPQSGRARPHKCGHCRRSFTRKHDLERHQVLHDDAGAFKCGVCARGFARMDVLQRHASAVHKNVV
ncbi:hypothetical protein IWW50_003564 [Coemansia erecta]|nr:hypothetical protein IWW50_003564 [Coemansia erecta]